VRVRRYSGHIRKEVSLKSVFAPKGNKYLGILTLMLSLVLLGCGTYPLAEEGTPGVPAGVIPRAPNPTGLRIGVWTDQPAYQVGQHVKVFFSINEDAYVYVYNVDARHQVFTLFPNQYSPNNFRQKGIYQLPDNPTWVLEVFEATGQEAIVGVATKEPVSILPSQVLGALISSDGSQFAQQVTATIQGLIPREQWATDFVLFNTMTVPPPAFGDLGIESQPEIGAAIYVDGQLRGFTPKEHIPLEAGSHTFWVTRNCPGPNIPLLSAVSHFESWPETVVIQPGQHYDLTVQLRPRWEDFETGHLTCLPWQSGGDATWTVQSQVVASGQFAAQAGIISHRGKSWLQITVEVPSPSQVSFKYRVSSEGNYDFLRFYIDGSEVQRWSGEMDWQLASFPVLAGVHTLRWEYAKDSSISKGRDTAWLDEIQLPWPR
jgi:hypothetical protein